MHTHASWYSPELTLKIDEEEKKWLNKVIIFVFFAHKKYSRSFIKLRLNHWCHMDYFNDVLTTLLGLECVSCVAVYGGSGSSRISSKISSFVFWRSYKFGTTWRWVINDIFGWTIPLMFINPTGNQVCLQGKRLNESFRRSQVSGIKLLKDV